MNAVLEKRQAPCTARNAGSARERRKEWVLSAAEEALNKQLEDIERIFSARWEW